MLELEFAELSDVGTARDNNEDCVGHCLPQSDAERRTHGWLFALADGVGGESHGEVASRTAIETLTAGFRGAPKGEAHTALLPRLLQIANAKIYELARARGSRMATTVVACALRYDRAVLAHAGDSRCYLIRNGVASPLTRDHTVAAEQARIGLATAAGRHLLSRSLGNDLFVNVEIGDLQVQAGDVLLLCSDGFHGPVDRSEIGEIVASNPAVGVAAKKLIALANEKDGGDNVSVQLIRIKSVERTGMYRGRPYKLK